MMMMVMMMKVKGVRSDHDGLQGAESLCIPKVEMEGLCSLVCDMQVKQTTRGKLQNSGKRQ
jgi:hypothetical protein